MSAVRGWCPSAWRPMVAGDGLLLRVRPPLARLTRAQALLVAELATAYGNGAIDLTRRAALQLRGFDEAGWRTAVDRLVSAGLVDPDPAIEGVALTVAPDWREGDDTHRVAFEMTARRGELPALPAKFGIAVDAGERSVLGDTPADLRLERGDEGGLILRADGRATGTRLTRGREVEAVVALAEWFAASGGTAAGRMARHAAVLPDWASESVAPLVRKAAFEQVAPGFGRLTSAALAALADDAEALRVTPWRSLLMERGRSVRSLRADLAQVLPLSGSAGAVALARFDLDLRGEDHSPHWHVKGVAEGSHGRRATLNSPAAPVHQPADDPSDFEEANEDRIDGSTQACAMYVQVAAHPRPAIDASVGAPACSQATTDTRALAGRLAATSLAGPIHVSGCAKGCARSAPAALTIVGRGGRYDLVRDGRADSPPFLCDLTAAALLAQLGAD